MKINKRCLSAFSKTKPFLALGTKSKLFDTSFSLTSELSLYDYSSDTHYPTLQLDRKFCKLTWCEKNDKSVLATGHDNGMVSLYEPLVEGSSFRVLNSFDGMEGDVLGLDFNTSKNVLAAGSSNGKIIFWNLDKIDQQYRCDIPITGNITSLSWNRKVSRILCAGTDDGRILVLDIRAKNIAMTLESPEVKTVSSISWHPKCPTSIFASTNLDCLSHFNLSTDSSTTIGNQKSLDFDLINDNTLVTYSKEQISYIDIDKLEVKSSELVEGLFEASFSSRDPLCCISTSNGTTTIIGRRDSEILSSNSQVILSDYIVSRDKLKINYPKISCDVSNDLNHSVMKTVYESGRFNLTDSNRKEVASLILDSLKQEETIEDEVFDLKDSVIEALIRQDFDSIIKGTTSIDLKFILDLLYDKGAKDSNSNSPIELLLSLIVTKQFDSIIHLLSLGQWKLMVCILLFSDFAMENCKKVLEKIESLLNEKGFKDKELILLLNNNPSDILNSIDTSIPPPESVFKVNEFFSEYSAIVEKFKALGVETNNKFIEEFYWYAKGRGLYELVKDLKKEKEIDLRGLSLSERKPVEDQPLQSPVSYAPPQKQLYSSSFNKSLSSFGRSEGPSMPHKKPGSSSVLTPPVGRSFAATPTSSTLPPSVPSPVGFVTRPPVRQSLYSCASSGSTPSFNKPKPQSVPGTYGAEGTLTPKTTIPTPKTTIPTPKTTIPTPKTTIPTPLTSPKQDVKPSIPKPGQSLKPSPTPTEEAHSYDVQSLTNEFERIYDQLKEEAGKKNNLIIGNKIKDANRRYSVYAGLDKATLTKNVLYRLSLIVQTFKEVEQKDVLKQSIRLIVEESNDLQENQCNIWMPSIFILVQLVY